jgi:3-(3-hydroxy-phenyl)propionate hydroxylase
VAFTWADGTQGVFNDLLRWANGQLLLLVFGDMSAGACARVRQLALNAPVRALQVIAPEARAQALEHVRDHNAKGAGHLQAACHVFGHAWALVRPDGYLVATGEAVDGHLVGATAKAMGLQDVNGVKP